MRRLAVCLCLLANCALCSCGFFDPPPLEAHSAADIQVELISLPDTAPSPDNSVLSCAVMDGAVPTVSILASKLDGAKALTCRLRIDPQQWRAGALKPSALWGAPDGVVSLAVEPEPGVVDIGIALVHWDRRDGISGSGELARLGLLPAASAPRQPSAQVAPSCLTGLVTIERPAGILSWPWVFIGDYDLNGEVNISDLTPLAMRLGHGVAGPLGVSGGCSGYEYDPDVVCDGDLNGEVNISDLSQIGQHYGQQLIGFMVFKSDDWWRDYPRPDFAAPALPTYSTVGFAHAIAGSDTQRTRIVLDVDEAPRGNYWWVIPYGDFWVGRASNCAEESGIKPARHELEYGLAWNATTGVLSWFDNIAGDTDHNGVVDVSDLTQIGAHRSEHAISDRADGAYIVDVNRDGLIDWNDWAGIGPAFGGRADGYSVFMTALASQLPMSPYLEPLLAPATSVKHSLLLHQSEGLRSMELPELVSGNHVWIQPYAEDDNGHKIYGVASEVIQVP